MILKLLLLVLLAMFTSSVLAQMPPLEPGVSHDLAIWRAAHYSDVRYKLNLTLEKMSPVLKGSVEIRVNVRDAETRRGGDARKEATAKVPPIILDWRKIKGNERLSTISNVTVNDVNVSEVPVNAFLWKKVLTFYVDDNEHLVFHDGVRLGENVIKLDFTSPILTSGAAVTRYVDKEDGGEYIYSLFVPSDASAAFPVFDQPDLKARFTVDIDAPSGWKVISNMPTNGLEIFGTTHDPNWLPHTITRFKETKPISTYVFAFAAGPFEAVGDKGRNLSGSEGVKATRTQSTQKNTLPTGRVSAADARVAIHIYVRRSQAKKFEKEAPEVFRLTRGGRKYLESYFDFKFPFPKYDLVLIPEFPFGGMEHAGATFLREDRIIFPQEPTKNDYITRANVIFHETTHQWFGDTVTMKWFDDLWLKEGFAEFMAYKTLEKVMPEYNAWKIFYERNKQAAYATDSTKGTTPIYQPIDNLSAAKSAYGNIVYRKAPSFLRQAEFYLGEDKFQTAVQAFLKKHAFANAGWEDLVKEFEAASGQDLQAWARVWVTQRGMPTFRIYEVAGGRDRTFLRQQNVFNPETFWQQKLKVLIVTKDKRLEPEIVSKKVPPQYAATMWGDGTEIFASPPIAWVQFVFPNYQDYGYGIFLLDNESRDYVLKNIQNEKDDFLRTMMWGSLWDSVREGELDPKEYVELVVKNIGVEKDESTIATLLNRVSIAMNYYLSDDSVGSPHVSKGSTQPTANVDPSLTVGLRTRVETMLMDDIEKAPTLGQRITFYRAFLNIASTPEARDVMKRMLKGRNASVNERAASRTKTDARSLTVAFPPLRTKDKFDIVTRLLILGDPDAPKLLADLERTETSDEAKRYAYAAKAGIANAENKEKYWNDFINNKSISESWIESAMGPFNSIRQSELTLPYLERALAELPNLKRNRKIFFVNGWLGAFIGGQRDEKALAIVNKFLADNPNPDKDLRLKILENVDVIERSVKIRKRFSHE